MSFGKLLGNFNNLKEKYRPLENISDDDFSEEQSCVSSNEDVAEDVKISSRSAFWNICNSIQGVAILAMPYVIKGGGWWSILAMGLVAVLSNYTGQILIKCHYDDVFDEVTGETKQVRVRVSYADIGDSVWPYYGKQVVLAVQVLELLFMATLYPIVATSVMRALLPNLALSSGMWVIVFGVLMLPNIFLRQLRHISIFSTITVISATAIFIAVTVYCFTEAESWHAHDLREFDLKEFVASIGVMIASYSSQMYLSVIESDMKHPQKIGPIMNWGYLAMTSLKIGIGVIAYLTFGEDTKQVVSLNLPPGFILKTVNLVVLILSLTSYTLPMFTVFEILEKDSKWMFNADYSTLDDKPKDEKDGKEKTIRRTIIRLFLVFVTLIMAISVPHFCLVLSFIGSFTGAFLEMVFPCFFYMVLKYDKLTKFEIGLNLFIVVFSLIFMGIGMLFSASAMVTAFKLHTKEVWTVD